MAGSVDVTGAADSQVLAAAADGEPAVPQEASVATVAEKIVSVREGGADHKSGVDTAEKGAPSSLAQGNGNAADVGNGGDAAEAAAATAASQAAESAGSEEKPVAESAEGKDKPSEEGGAGKRTRKRKSLWDANPPEGTAAASPAATAAAVTASLASPAATLLPGAVAGSPAAAQLLLQQQQQLLQMRALAQAKIAEAASQQMQQPSHSAACRVYVGSIYYDLTETDMLLTFSPFGQITKIDMPKDANTGKHKGFCFIEYTNPESATAAITTMDGFTLAGRKIKVNRPNNVASASSSPSATIINPLVHQALAMSPVAAAAAAAASQTGSQNPLLQAQVIASTISMQHGIASATPVTPTPAPPAPNTRIYVGSIVYDLGEPDVTAIFQAFGRIKSVQLIPNPETGKHKGYGFVEYESEEAAKGAIQCMNGFQLGGRQLKVGWASSTHGPTGSSSTAAAGQPGALPSPGILGMSGSAGFPPPTFASPLLATPGAPAPAAAAAPAPDPNLLLQQMLAAQKPVAAAAGVAPPAFAVPPLPQVENASLDKEENLSISRDQRMAMMQRLSATGARPQPAPAAPPASGRCVLLSNMVGPEEVDDDLQSEVTDECGKFGKVEKVVIYQEQRSAKPGDAVVKIFVLFTGAAEGHAAQKALHGRWFGGKQVQASFYPDAYFLRDDFTH